MTIESFYICRECGASYSDGEVDCYECDGQMCCYLFQAETYEEAKLMAEKQFCKEDKSEIITGINCEKSVECYFCKSDDIYEEFEDDYFCKDCFEDMVEECSK